MRKGYAPDDPPGGSRPPVDWSARDLQDSGAVTEESIRKDYNAPKSAAVYRAWVPMEEVPTPVLAEEDDEYGGEVTYDWSEIQSHRGNFPPVKLRITPEGKTEILDGNHRIKAWEEQSRMVIPAWIIDERKGAR